MPESMPSLFVLAYWLAESTAERAQPASKPTQTLSDRYLNVLDCRESLWYAPDCLPIQPRENALAISATACYGADRASA